MLVRDNGKAKSIELENYMIIGWKETLKGKSLAYPLPFFLGSTKTTNKEVFGFREELCC